MNNEDKDAMESIAYELTELAEERIINDDMSDEQYRRNLHHILGNVPTPAAPAHLAVLERVKHWKAMGLVPVGKQLDELHDRIKKAAKNTPGAGGSGNTSAAAPALPGWDDDDSDNSLLVDEEGYEWVDPKRQRVEEAATVEKAASDDGSVEKAPSDGGSEGPSGRSNDSLHGGESGSGGASPASPQADPAGETDRAHQVDYEALTFEPGDVCVSYPPKGAEGRIKVVRIGTAGDYFNEGKVYISYEGPAKRCMHPLKRLDCLMVCLPTPYGLTLPLAFLFDVAAKQMGAFSRTRRKRTTPGCRPVNSPRSDPSQHHVCLRAAHHQAALFQRTHPRSRARQPCLLVPHMNASASCRRSHQHQCVGARRQSA